MVRFRASPYAFIKVITVHDFTLVGRRKKGSLFIVAKRLPLNMGRRPAHTVQVSGGILEWGRPPTGDNYSTLFHVRNTFTKQCFRNTSKPTKTADSRVAFISSMTWLTRALLRVRSPP